MTILYGFRVLLILFCVPIDICTLVVYACLLAYRYFSPETALAVAESQSKNVILMIHGSGADNLFWHAAFLKITIADTQGTR
jgi:hypothetical protein